MKLTPVPCKVRLMSIFVSDRHFLRARSSEFLTRPDYSHSSRELIFLSYIT